MATEWKHGYYYCNMDDDSPNPKVHQCRKLPVLGFYLFPMSGIIRIPFSANTEGRWVDCSTAYLRSEAIKCSLDCHLETITSKHLGKVISYVEEDGTVSDPCFLFAMVEKLAFVMDLDGSNKIRQVKVDKCYPLQEFYTDIANRAIDPDPRKRPMFGNLLAWVGRTDAYKTFTSLVESSTNNLEMEDMLRLMEVLTCEGVSVANFKEEVQKRYDAIPEDKRQGDNMYQVVYEAHKGPAKNWTPIEREIMRRTEFRYTTPKQAWEEEGSGPMPSRMSEVDKIRPKKTPEDYVSEKLGLYLGGARGYWRAYMEITPEGGLRDFDKDYEVGVAQYLEKRPDFDMQQLQFIQEEDKASVFKEILGVKQLDEKDPYRAWMENPPEEFVQRKSRNPRKTYPEIFVEIYRERQLAK